jgi:hypothetical protein
MNQEDKIRNLAYRLYLARGKKRGSSIGDWLTAERIVACQNGFLNSFATLYFL